jgi:hypothetical protein
MRCLYRSALPRVSSCLLIADHPLVAPVGAIVLNGYMSAVAGCMARSRTIPLGCMGRLEPVSSFTGLARGSGAGRGGDTEDVDRLILCPAPVALFWLGLVRDHDHLVRC